MPRPNILFMFADQLRYDALACNGNRIVHTPNIDRLAREGITFDHALSSCPICSPYRGQLLTGCYSHVNGIIDNEYRFTDGQVTLAHILAQAGYHTTYTGKWHLGYPPYTATQRYGFDDMFAYNCEHAYHHVSYWHNEDGPFPMVGFAPRVETQLVLDHIRDHVDEHPEQPFCALLSWGPPHWSSVYSERDYGDYPQEYAIYHPDEIEVPGNVPRQFREFAAREFADYYGMTTALDDCMGRILSELDNLGLAENTIVCFSSDHGDHLSAHGYGKPDERWMPPELRASKFTPYEEAVHIPFILRYPAKVKGKRRTNTIFNSVDVLPTLLGLCGAMVPEEVQGTDLSHIACGIPGPEPDSAFLQILGPGWPSRTKSVGLWRGVRTERYTYARWRDRDGLRVLYDHKNDPLEMHNRINESRYAPVAAEMEERLQRWVSSTADPFDTGPRLPATDMLDLGQQFTHPKWHDLAPHEYVEALAKRKS
ncbi:MAG: sulfatase [Anaerolineae bacterium]|nr:sulfatase [Anaerolineae bacterium]